ncbi:uncharacterized protein C6orf118-like [Brachyhypopomus gauderio]|uniref:uncharacterized protein C6orf118-like n=1 Tax=Brachyhypopomus gauderio TaxID=698409 RepID=UPI0040411A85
MRPNNSLRVWTMSVPGRPRLSGSALRQERKQLLLGVERAHRADIQTYSSGHLGPRSFFPKLPPSRPVQPVWEGSRHPRKPPLHARPQEGTVTDIHVEEMMDALYNFTMATTLQQPETQACPSGPDSPAGPGRSWRAAGPERPQTRDAPNMTDLSLVKPGLPRAEAEQVPCWCKRSPLATPTRRGGLQLSHLTTSGQEARRHERWLEQELRRTSAHGGPARERLAAFRRVFDDVCDGALAFCGALREIKMEYDLMLDSLLSTQSTQQDSSAFVPFNKAFLETSKLDQATREVWSLEELARTALRENDRVRTEYENAQASEQQMGERGTESPHPGHSDLTAAENGARPDLDQDEATVSTVTQLEAERRQVWRVWKEVQELQKEIRETMVSTVTTNALQECIRDTKAEIRHLVNSNEHLRSANKAR